MVLLPLAWYFKCHWLQYGFLKQVKHQLNETWYVSVIHQASMLNSSDPLVMSMHWHFASLSCPLPQDDHCSFSLLMLFPVVSLSPTHHLRFLFFKITLKDNLPKTLSRFSQPDKFLSTRNSYHGVSLQFLISHSIAKLFILCCPKAQVLSMCPRDRHPH